MSRICESALEALQEPGGIPLNYKQLPEAALGRLAAHFQCAWSGEEIAQMRQAATRDAKRPDRQFSADGGQKQREASARIREVCEQNLAGLYRRLECKREQSAP